MSNDGSSPTISQLLASYTEYLSAPSLTMTAYINATQTLTTVFKALLISSDINSLNTVWAFFIANQDGIVQESLALQGIGVLSLTDRFTYGLLYSMFRQATRGIKPADAAAMVPIVIQSTLIVQYLQSQTNAIAANATLPPPLSFYGTGLISTGNGTQASALVLPTLINQFVSAPPDTAAILQLIGSPAEMITVINDDPVNTLSILPQVGASIGTVGTNNPIGVPPISVTRFYPISSTHWSVG